MSNVGLDRTLGLGLTSINSLVPCSGFPPTEESVPNSTFPRSLSAVRTITLELSLVRTDELNEYSVKIPWVAGRFFHYVMATAAFADVENRYTVHRYSTRVELVRLLEPYRCFKRNQTCTMVTTTIKGKRER